MQILILSLDPVTEVGGVEGRVRTYVKCLVKAGHQVYVYDVSRSAARMEESLLGAAVGFLSPAIGNIFSSLGIILRKIEKTSTDAVFVLSGTDAVIGLLLLAYARFRRIKSGAFLYGKDILSAKTSPPRFLMLLLGMMLARKLGVNSHATAGLLPTSLRRKTSILYPGVDPEISAEMGIVKASSNTILFVGRLVTRKGVDDLLDAFSLVLREVPDAELEIVGDGPERQKSEELAVSLGIQNHVHFFGTLVGKELYQRYSQCTVFVMPSKTMRGDVEGFGTVFLEAGLFAKPSVGTYSGGIPEAVIDGQTGVLIKEGDIVSLRDALVRLLQDKESSAQLGEKARRRVLSEFTSKKSTERLLALFS